MATRSSLFQTFLSGINAPMEGFVRDRVAEYPGIGALYLLTGDERAEAEEILIDRLSTNDPRAATALASAGSTRAIPALVERTGRATPSPMRLSAARALLRLGDHSGRASLIDLLRDRGASVTDRSSAARLLAEFPEPDKEFLLAVAATDPDDTVRLSAIRALSAVYRLDDDETARGEVLSSIAGRMLSPLVSVRDEAAAELRAILARLERGEEPAALGLTWHVDPGAEPLGAFIASVTGDRSAPGERAEVYALDGVAGLTGRERRVVEDLLLLYLHRDVRAVRAAASLGIHRTIEPLREMLASASEGMRTEASSALRVLTGDG